MQEINRISLAEYNQLEKSRCTQFHTTLLALCYAYEEGRITRARFDELERILRVEFEQVTRPDRIRGFIRWTQKICEELSS